MSGKFERNRITIKKPTGNRVSFSLILDKVDSKNIRTQKKINSQEVQSINRRLKTGEIAIDVAYQLIIIEKDKLLHQLGFQDINDSIIHGDNKRLTDLYLREINNSKELEPESIYNIRIDLNRILEMLSNESLYVTH